MTALTKVLGSADAAPDLERRLRQPIPTVTGSSQAADPSATAQPVSSLLDQTTTRQEAIRTRTVPAASAPPTTQHTRVSTGRPPSGPATATRPRAKPSAPPPATQQRKRRWIGLLLVLAVLLIAAGIISAIILDRRLSVAPETNDQSGTSERSPAQQKKLTIAGARDFNPRARTRPRIPMRSDSPTMATPPPAGVRFSTLATRNWATSSAASAWCWTWKLRSRCARCTSP